jgi:hypothetical protein
MDQQHLTRVTRSLSGMPSRRDVLRGLAAAGLGLGSARLPVATEAKKRKRKKKEKQPKPNAFGCLEVGDACTSEEQCCSGICDGKKGERKCRAHDAGTCKQDAVGVCREGNPLLALCNQDVNCVCFRTTAGSNACAQLIAENGSQCADCQKDADCLTLGFPTGTVCAPLVVGICDDMCEGTMGCMVPCATGIPE